MFIPLSDLTRTAELLEAMDAAGFSVRAAARLTPDGRFAGVELLAVTDLGGVRDFVDVAAPAPIGTDVGRVWFMRPANQDDWEIPFA
jgi:hypothetical protein